MMTSGHDYFSSYCDLGVHQLMLKDRPRTLAYRNFFEKNREYVKDKVVMDVGAGTGILSLFAAAAGAKKVFAVEASGVASLCEEVVSENSLADVIEVIHGAVEEISLPQGFTHVDIIVSEWMGFYLLHESMLDSVIVARDRFLAPGGILAPSHATLYFAPVDLSEHFQERAEEWSNIYGFDFSPVASRINMDEVSKPLVQCLSPSVLRADPQEVLALNLQTVTLQDVAEFSKLLQFPLKHDSKIFGFAAWFDVDFVVGGTVDGQMEDMSGPKVLPKSCVNEMGDACSGEAVHTPCTQGLTPDPSDMSHTQAKQSSLNPPTRLRTGPLDPPTHWKQTIIFLPQTIFVEGGVSLGCHVTMSQDASNKRHYNITVELVEEEDSDADSISSTDHPVPCPCGSSRCRLISALVDKFDTEQQDMCDEASAADVQAEDEATRQLDDDIERGGWPVDPNSSGHSLDETGSS
ncbi:uncharacterized protein LOC131956406 [Physella acuta]|uniref:uncharacterized protein LOC131956406 n=1 Tax=Physella acuta TaxID=109671 RepID=UPI0027DE2936|nr:uncharacterized protein LOC131956406 [Physella acuta]XP_059176809.1 uncharacterized protein LOC131956406 [Physella acuta]